MKIYSDNGLKVTKYFESLRLDAHRPVKTDPLTIGWGHTGDDVKPGMVITQQQADKLLLSDIAKAERLVQKHVDVSTLTQGQYDCLVDMTFNMGAGFIAMDNVVGDFDDAVRNQQWDKVEAAIPLFRRAGGVIYKGLQRRRAANAAIWRGAPADQAIKEALRQFP